MNAPAAAGDRRVADGQALAAALAARGHALAPHDGPPPMSIPERPWFVALLLGFAGWLAGGFGLGFLALLLKPGDDAFVPLGCVLIAVARVFLRPANEGNFFTTQLGLVLSIAGQFSVVAGLALTVFRHADAIGALSFIVAVMQLALVLVMPNRLHRMLSALFACAAWAFCLRFGLWDDSGPGRPLYPHDTGFLLPLVAWVVAWLPPGLVLLHALRTEARWMAAGHAALARPACAGIIVALAWATLLCDPFGALRWSDEHSSGDALWPLLSMLAAAGALLAAFALRSRGLMGVCLVGGLLHVVVFYNALAIPLLAKSLTMLALGGLALATARWMKPQEGRP